jgi:hypothetical protein
MHRTAHILAIALLLAAHGVGAGCSGSGGLATTTVEDPDAPAGGLRNDNPQARPVAVAWTVARAKRCGFYFDGAKLRTSYFAFEASQGNTGEKLAAIEKIYDSTYKTISDKVSADAGYCTDKKGAEIKAELQRHLAGDFNPNLPKPKVVQACGLLGCASPVSDQPFNTKDFYEKQDREATQRR